MQLLCISRAQVDRLCAGARNRLFTTVTSQRGTRRGLTVTGFLLVPRERYSSSRHLWCAYSSAVPRTGTGWRKGADSPAHIREEVLRGEVACVLEGVLRRWLQQDRDRRSEHELHRHR